MPDHESLNDALITCVRAAGGSKQVGHKLWPSKTVDAAQRHLLNCLNEGKAERLDPEQVLQLAGLARRAGCHAYAEFANQVLCYGPPVPIEPKDEADQLRRDLLQMGKVMQSALARLESIEQSTGLRTAG